MNGVRNGSLPAQGRIYPSFLPACAVLALLGVLFVLVPALAQQESNGLQQAENGQAGLVSQVLAQGLKAPDGFDEGVLASYDAALPEGFEEEVYAPVPEGALATGHGVVGFSVEGDVASVFAQVRSVLEGKGWTYIESGTSAFATFVKDEGPYAWVSVSLVQIDESVSVVFSLKKGEGDE